MSNGHEKISHRKKLQIIKFKKESTALLSSSHSLRGDGRDRSVSACITMRRNMCILGNIHNTIS